MGSQINKYILPLSNVMPQIITTVLFFMLYNNISSEQISLIVSIEATFLFLSSIFIIGLDKLVEKNSHKGDVFVRVSLFLLFISIVALLLFMILNLQEEKYYIILIGVVLNSFILIIFSEILSVGDAKLYFVLRIIRSLIIGFSPFLVLLIDSVNDMFLIRFFVEVLFIVLFYFLYSVKSDLNIFSVVKNIFNGKNFILTRKELSYALPFVLTTASSLCFIHLDKIILFNFMDSEIFSNYIVLQKIFLIIVLLLSSFFIRVPIKIFNGSINKKNAYNYFDIAINIMLITTTSIILFFYISSKFINFDSYISNIHQLLFLCFIANLSVFATFFTASFLLDSKYHFLNMSYSFLSAITFISFLYVFRPDTGMLVYSFICLTNVFLLFLHLMTLNNINIIISNKLFFLFFKAVITFLFLYCVPFLNVYINYMMLLIIAALFYSYVNKNLKNLL